MAANLQRREAGTNKQNRSRFVLAARRRFKTGTFRSKCVQFAYLEICCRLVNLYLFPVVWPMERTEKIHCQTGRKMCSFPQKNNSSSTGEPALVILVTETPLTMNMWERRKPLTDKQSAKGSPPDGTSKSTQLVKTHPRPALLLFQMAHFQRRPQLSHYPARISAARHL